MNIRGATIISLFALFNLFGDETNSVASYVDTLEARFLNGESPDSIRESFATNGLYSFYELLPYCYAFPISTNDIAVRVERYKSKLAFLESIRPRDPIFVSSNMLALTRDALVHEEDSLIRFIIEQYVSSNYDTYWIDIYPKATQMWSAPVSGAFALTHARKVAKNGQEYAEKVLGSHNKRFSYAEMLNIDNYCDAFSRDELYSELSTNSQFNADAMFKYCVTEKSDFETNNIAIAEKQIWRNNFVLEIVTRSCNLHTNEKNRAYNDAYTNRLVQIRAHYDAIPEPHLGMTGTELEEWRTRLRNTIRAYTDEISPFQKP